MQRLLLRFAAVGLVTLFTATSASAQKTGGVLRIYQYDSPASMSIHEEALNSVQNPMMAVFNNLVLFKPDESQNRMDTIVPDLATKWSWNADLTALTFQLRGGVSWHDGKPFGAADVKCTWDLILGKSTEKLRANPRKAWYRNLEDISTEGDTVTFHLKRPQPAFIALLASGYSPVYPCHVPPQVMRQHPIGTGPFKFVSYNPNESIKLVRNAQYWKQGRPYLDGIEWTIIPNRSTAILALHHRQVRSDVPVRPHRAADEEYSDGGPKIRLCFGAGKPKHQLDREPRCAPFDSSEIRRAMALALDRKSFIDILAEGNGDIGAAMQPRATRCVGYAGRNAQDIAGL